MKLEYDPESDAAYVGLCVGEIVESEEIEPGVILDYDARGRVVGIEILYLSKRRSDAS